MDNIAHEYAEIKTVTPVSPSVSSVLWTVKQVASFLNLRPGTVYRMVERGELPVLRIGTRGRTLRFRQTEVERWLLTCQK